VELFDLPQARRQAGGCRYLGAIILDFSILAAWSALYSGINYYLLLEEESTSGSSWKASLDPRSWRCCATSSTRISCSTR
jgi:hypothetical protein